MSQDPVGDLYSRIGEDKIRQLVTAFYRRVRQDDVLAPMYPPHDLDGAERRLADFLVYRLGGPTTYLESRGHPRLRMRHAPFQVNRLARDRWFAAMSEAIGELGLEAPEADPLRAFFETTASFLINSE